MSERVSIRRLTGKWIMALAAGITLAAAAVFPAFAGTVDSVRLEFTDRYQVGEILEPELECRTSGISVVSLEWNKKVEDWKPGSRVSGTVLLSCDDGREFLSSYGNKTMRIYGARLTGAKAEDGNLKVTVSYEPVVQLDSPDSAGWSNSARTKASWKSVKYATGYQIRLYRDDSFVRTIDVTGTSRDLSEYMNKEGMYYYEVRAVGRDEEDRKYRKSSEYTTSSDYRAEDLGDTSGQWRNYLDGRKYEKEDGSFVKGEWYRIDGSWYYFDENEFMATGWRRTGEGVWYYLGNDGNMLTGWQEIDGVWYYFTEDGSMYTGWLESTPGEWYYLNADGSMASGVTIDGRSLDASGTYRE